MKHLKIIILSTVLALLLACGEKETLKQNLYMSIVNQTEKHLLYAIETSEKNDTIISTGMDSVSAVFYRMVEIEKSLLPGEHFYPGVVIVRETLFNFTDTSKYSYYCLTLIKDKTAEELIFARHRFFLDDMQKNGTDYSVLYFTDSIVNIMQKDYAMLEKFKEHYAAK